jgi:SH3 domain-containing YSC84-like protein 1
MKTLLRAVLFAITLSNVTFAAEAASSRLQAAATVLDEIMATPDKGIPSDILGSAKCVAVVPSLLKGGFVVGAAHGRGMATCRLATGWSAPAPLTTTGGSVGLQIGGQAVDLVMVVMNDRGMQALLSSKFKLGADASVAAGPVGRHTEGSTDWKLRAEVLTYSRARGLFAGISFNGAVIKQDEDATRELYGRMVDFKTILTGSVASPQTAESFIAAVRKAVGTDTAPATPVNSAHQPASTAPVNPPPAATPAPAPATETAPASEPAPAATPAATPASPPFTAADFRS